MSVRADAADALFLVYVEHSCVSSSSAPIALNGLSSLHVSHIHAGEAEFKRLNRAYALLSDPTERAKYDAARQQRQSRRSKSDATDPSLNAEAVRNFVNDIMKQDQQINQANHRSNPTVDFRTWFQGKQQEQDDAARAAREADEATRRKEVPLSFPGTLG